MQALADLKELWNEPLVLCEMKRRLCGLAVRDKKSGLVQCAWGYKKSTCPKTKKKKKLYKYESNRSRPR